MNTEIIGEIKRRLFSIIDTTVFDDDDIINYNIRTKVKKSIGDNWFDDRFKIDTLEEAISERYKRDVLSTGKEIITNEDELWKAVCINAASHSDMPEIIADNVIDARIKNVDKLRKKYLG